MQTLLPAYDATAIALTGHKLACGCLEVMLENTQGERWKKITPTYSIQRKMNRCREHFPQALSS